MGCGFCKSDDSELKLPTNKEGEVDFRDNHGCCRDLYCLILFIACVIGMIVIFGIGFSEGEPAKLYAPMDKYGGYCGLEKFNANDKGPGYPYIVYYNVMEPTEGICVDECPVPGNFCYTALTLSNGDIVGQRNDNNMSDCLSKTGSLYRVLPNDELNVTLDDINEFIATIKDLDIAKIKELLVDDLHLNINFVIEDSMKIVNRCIPNIKDVLEKVQEIGDVNLNIVLNDVFTSAVNDLKESWWLFLATVGITLVVAFVIIFCLQCFAKLITWCLCFAAILLVAVIAIISLVYGFNHYKDPLQSDKTSSKIFIGFGFATLAADLILIILLIALRKRISLAAALVQVASDAIKSNMCLILVPIVYALIFVIVVVLMIITMIYYFSSLDWKTDGAGFRSFKVETKHRGVVVFVVFCFWWVTFFLIGMNQYTIAGAGAYHYFSRKGEKPVLPIARTLKTLLLHHLGSIGVGSFLIAVVATVRTILLYLAKKAKGAKNEQLKCLISCLQCCLGCLQRLVEFIASRAYIMMAIQGKNFWVSAFDALTLLLGNPIRTALLTAISKFLIIMAELTVAGLSVLAAFIILRPDVFSSETKPFIAVIYWWFVAFICAIIAFFLTWIIFQVYETLIDTMFFCFLYDEHMEVIGGDSYTTYCPEDMKGYMTVMDTNAREEEEDDGCCCCCGGSGNNGNSGSGSVKEPSKAGNVDV